MSRRRAVGLSLAVVLAGAALQVAIAWKRPADIDEGTYLAAAALVERGQRPYYDFAFPQMPAFPYLCAAVSRLVPARTLAWGRAGSVACAIGILGVFAILSFRLAPDRPSAVLGIVLLAGGELGLAWFPTVKIHSPAALLLLGGFAAAVWAEGGRTRTLLCAALSGAAFGLATSFRSFLAPALLPAGAWLTLRGGGAALASFAAGAAVGLVPAAIFALPDPGLFWFHNMAYHAEARGTTFFADPAQKVFTFLSLLASFQTSVLLLLGVAAAGLGLRSRGWREFLRTPEALGLAVCGVLGIVFLLPTPTFNQYYCVLMPILLAAGLPAVGRVPRGTLLTVGVTMYLAAAPVYVYREVKKWSDHPPFHLSTVREVSEAVEGNSRPDDVLLDFWGAYLWTTGRVGYPGTAGYMSLQLGRVVGDERARETNTPSVDEILSDLRARRIAVVVWTAQAGLKGRVEEVEQALRENYEAVYEANGVVVFRAHP